METETTYRIAEHAGDYRKIHELMKAEGFPPGRVSFPTLMAFRGDELVGFIATDTTQNMVIAGPMALKSDIKRPVLALRLAEKYEQVLKNLGIKSFIIAADPGSIVDQAIKRYFPDWKPYAGDGQRLYYLRRID